MRHCLKKKISVKCLVRNPKKLRWLEGLPVEIIPGDCSDKKSLEPAVCDVDYIFHSAGLVRALKSDEFYLTNVKGTKNLIEAVAEKNPNIKRFIHISSQAAAGPCINDKKTENDIPNPVSHYGFSKLLGEREVLKFQSKLPITILRPPSVYGPRDKDVFVFFKYVKKGFFPLPSAEKFINISFISDIVGGIIAAAESERAKGQTYFVGDDTVFSWRSLGKVLGKTINPKTKIIKIPEFIFYISAFFSEILAKLKNEPPIVSFDKLNEMKQKKWLFSIEKAKNDFGYIPKVTLEEGIKIAYDWYIEKGWL